MNNNTKLINGKFIPCIGYGTWQTPNGEVAYQTITDWVYAFSFVIYTYTHRQNNVVPLHKSLNKERIIQNADVFDFELSTHDMDIITNMEICEFSGYPLTRIGNKLWTSKFNRKKIKADTYNEDTTRPFLNRGIFPNEDKCRT